MPNFFGDRVVDNDLPAITAADQRYFEVTRVDLARSALCLDVEPLLGVGEGAHDETHIETAGKRIETIQVGKVVFEGLSRNGLVDLGLVAPINGSMFNDPR